MLLKRQVEKIMRSQSMVKAGDRLTVALSGGRDSICLLHLLKELQPIFQYQLEAVHVHHGLRPEADADAAFCEKVCNEWQVPLSVFRVDVKERVTDTGESIEEAARNLRYQVLQSSGADRIALAHHQQDQAETVLLALLRGSGLTGLCGMQEVRSPFIRPLLTIPPEMIVDYCKQNDLLYVTDASNQDTAFRRNRIRHELLPILQQFYNPQVVKVLAQTASHLQQEEAYLEAQVPPLPEGDLSVSWLLGFPIGMQQRIIRKFLKREGLTQGLTGRHIEQVLELANGQTGKRVNLPKGLTVGKNYDILRVYKGITFCQPWEQVTDFKMEFLTVDEARRQWDNPEQVPALPDEKWMDADRLNDVPVWRTREKGDYLMIPGGHKKLKDFWIDQKVPQQERAQVPLLADGSHVLWVYGYRLSDGVKITKNTQRVLHVWRKGNATR